MSEPDDGYIIRLTPQKGHWLAVLFRIVGKAGETRPLKAAQGESVDQALRELGASGTIELEDGSPERKGE